MTASPVSKVFLLPQTLPLDSGQVLEGGEIAYETYGELNETKSNAILICHAHRQAGMVGAHGGARQAR